MAHAESLVKLSFGLDGTRHHHRLGKNASALAAGTWQASWADKRLDIHVGRTDLHQLGTAPICTCTTWQGLGSLGVAGVVVVVALLIWCSEGRWDSGLAGTSKGLNSASDVPAESTLILSLIKADMNRHS